MSALTSAPKIVIVGGGSFSWGPLFVRDLLLAPALAGARIVLHDVNPQALALVQGLGSRMVERLGRGCVEQALDVDQALAGADFVILTITTGGLEAMRHDVEIPERYGIYHSVGDTVGPGGLLRALRNIPVVVDLAERMQRLCPDAWLLNYTNPMTVLCRAVTRTSSIRTIGLCHEWHWVREKLSARFGVPPNEWQPRILGINHLPWLLDLQAGGKDYMPRLHTLTDEILAAGGLADSDTRSTVDRSMVKARLLQLYGALPVAGDRHVAEFFPLFLGDAAERGRKWGIERTPIEERYEWRESAREEIEHLMRDAAALDNWLAERSGEAADAIITALVAGGRYEGIMNLPNRGQAPNLPPGAVVETIGVIENRSARGLAAGDVPPAIEAILLRHIANQELTVEAALNGSRALALQALLGDALCPPDLHAAEQMLDEMLQANRRYLPQFF